jgi:hypothetical protein
MILHRKPSKATAAAAFDVLLKACGHTVVVDKPKKRRTPFNAYDGSDKRKDREQATHREALRRVTGMRS